ncbi:aminotransferase class V-fold PLP-dependent enzyme [Massilia rhizosphaerae]|uniref:aminotransferase class V-fold PLP-dependent enzyme n=1 Tax=Massilia rhizosphaerae TaxID=2784389 RepID=UPI0018DE5E24|nr:aminotransferase class V-fold PLP-dependent enzyme [Massilia rhizosphaerae]
MTDILPDDESYWSTVRAQYTRSADFINLENGYFGMPADPVRAAFARYQDEVDRENSFFLRMRWPGRIARVKALLAGFTGVAADELLITRSAVESMNILLQGYPFEAGDAILMARHDYDSSHDIVRMLAARKGLTVIQVDVPYDLEDEDAVAALYADAITPRTRVLLVTHIVHRTGRIMPVARLAALARGRGIDAIVDGAHALAQLDYTIPQLGAQFAAFNLHKWVGAPLGTGLLYVARERIADIAPLYGDVSFARDDIDKFGHVGTVPPAPIMAVEDALAFHAAIGGRNKEARLRWLARRWMDQVADVPGVRLYTPRDARLHCALGAFGIEGMPAAEVVRRLLEEHRIFTVVRRLGDVEAVRVTPHLHNGPADLDALAAAIRQWAPPR